MVDIIILIWKKGRREILRGQTTVQLTRSHCQRLNSQSCNPVLIHSCHSALSHQGFTMIRIKNSRASFSLWCTKELRSNHLTEWIEVDCIWIHRPDDLKEGFILFISDVSTEVLYLEKGGCKKYLISFSVSNMARLCLANIIFVIYTVLKWD